MIEKQRLSDQESKLVVDNIEIVNLVIKRHYFAARDRQELISIGYLALVRAVKSYDVKKGKLFSHLYSWIRSGISNYLRKRSRSISFTDFEKKDMKYDPHEDNMKYFNYIDDKIKSEARKLIDKKYDAKVAEMIFDYYFQSKTTRQIASKFNITRQAVERRLIRAKASAFVAEAVSLIFSNYIPISIK